MDHGRVGRIPVITEGVTHVGMVSHHTLVLVCGVVASLTAQKSFSGGDVRWHDSDIVFFCPFSVKGQSKSMLTCAGQMIAHHSCV